MIAFIKVIALKYSQCFMLRKFTTRITVLWGSLYHPRSLTLSGEWLLPPVSGSNGFLVLASFIIAHLYRRLIWALCLMVDGLRYLYNQLWFVSWIQFKEYFKGRNGARTTYYTSLPCRLDLEFILCIPYKRVQHSRKCLLGLSYLPTPPLGQDMTQGQFLSGVYQAGIQSFPSPRLVVSSRLKKSVCPTIYL